MSRSESTLAVDYANRLAQTEAIARRFAEQAEELAAVKEELSRLKAVQPAPKPETMSDRLREMNRKTTEYLKQFEENVKAQRAAEATAQKERMDAEARRLAAEPKSPDLHQIRALINTTESLLAYPGIDKYTFEQEEAILPYVERVINALIELEAAPVTGWPMTVRKALSGLTREIRSVLGGWGWYHLFVPQEARRTILDNLRKEWRYRAEIPSMRVAELWIQLAEEGTEPWPSDKVVRLGLTARERGYQRLEIMPRHRSPIMGENDLLDKISVPKLFDEQWNARGNTPMFGNGRPVFTTEQKNLLMGSISELNHQLPQAPRTWGWLVGGSTVAS